MTPAARTEVVPGVHRLGSSLVNWYLVEEDGRVVVVDGGLPAFWPQLEPALRALGRGLDDVAAIVLTHAHSDHTGAAGALHERGVPVFLHTGDHELLATAKEPWKHESSPLPHLWRPRVWRFLGHMARRGALKPPKLSAAQPIADGDRLDLPGSPRVVHAPGHTPGHCAVHFEGHRAIVVGDLMCTWNPISGSLGPQIMPSPFNVSSRECLESLAKIEGLGADAVLPGHGRPWTDGVEGAVAHARAVQPS